MALVVGAVRSDLTGVSSIRSDAFVLMSVVQALKEGPPSNCELSDVVWGVNVYPALHRNRYVTKRFQIEGSI